MAFVIQFLFLNKRRFSMEKHIFQTGSRLAFALIIIVFGSYIISAQQLTGTWSARNKAKSPDKIHISFSIESERGGKNQHGSSYDLSDLQGLSSLQPDGPV